MKPLMPESILYMKSKKERVNDCDLFFQVFGSVFFVCLIHVLSLSFYRLL